MTIENVNPGGRHLARDRRSGNRFAPPYLTDVGMVLFERRQAEMQFGPYAYRAWVEIDASRPTQWNGWYEIHTTDCKTMLADAVKLTQAFLTPEDAFTATVQKVKWEILNIIGKCIMPKIQAML